MKLSIIRYWILGISACLFLVLEGCATVPEVAFDQLRDPLLVVIDDPRSERRRRGAMGANYDLLINYEQDPVLQRVTREIAQDYHLTVGSQWPIQSLGVHCFLIEKPAADVLAVLNQDKRIRWVQPFNQFQVKSSQATRDLSQDPLKLPQLPYTGKGVDIVVVDTGADTKHPALRSTKLNYRDFAQKRGLGQKEAHGTAIIGLIAAADRDSQSPVKGLVPDADVHHFRGCWQDQDGKGRCNTLTLALALDAAVSVAPDLLNLSLSGPADPVLEAIVAKLLQQGTVVVSAFDEKRPSNQRFPQAQNGVIYAYGVGHDWPNNVPAQTLLAPANALSLAPNGEYDIFTGHSIATPQLTAMAASLLAGDPNLSQLNLATQLKQWLTTHYQANTIE